MKKIAHRLMSVILAAVLVFGLTGLSAYAETSGKEKSGLNIDWDALTPGVDYSEKDLIVTFQTGLQDPAIAAEVAGEYGCEAEIIYWWKDAPNMNKAHFEITDGTPVRDMIERLEADERIKFAEVSYYYRPEIQGELKEYSGLSLDFDHLEAGVDYVDGEVIATFDNNLQKVKTVYDVAEACGCEVKQILGWDAWLKCAHLLIKDGTSVQDMIARLEAMEPVRFAEVNAICQPATPTEPQPQEPGNNLNGNDLADEWSEEVYTVINENDTKVLPIEDTALVRTKGSHGNDDFEQYLIITMLTDRFDHVIIGDIQSGSTAPLINSTFTLPLINEDFDSFDCHFSWPEWCYYIDTPAFVDHDKKTVTFGESAIPNKVERFYGNNRATTSLAIADQIKALHINEVSSGKTGIGSTQDNRDRFSAVVLCTGENYPDALSGGQLAADLEAPVLLLRKKAADRRKVIDYIIENLSSKGRVYVVGGPAAVPDEWLRDLASYQIIRLEGSNRFKTNAAILTYMGTLHGRNIIASTGYDYPDALCATATDKALLLLDTKKTHKLAAEQVEYLKNVNKGIKPTIYLVGDKSVVGGFEKELKKYGSVVWVSDSSDAVTRSVAMAETFYAGKMCDRAGLAVSTNYPDGLCGGGLCQRYGCPLLLCPTDNAPESLIQYIKANKIHNGSVFGSNKVLTDETVRQIFPEAGINEIKYK